MTEWRAADLIRRIKVEETAERYVDRHKAFDLAIKALEEIRQYRELGTVKELRELKESNLSGLELAMIAVSVERLKKYESIGTIEELSMALENVKTLSRMYEKLNDQEVAEYHRLTEYEDMEKQGKLLKNPQKLRDGIIDKMKEFMDEYRGYSESSIDHFGGKADAMETAMRIVKAAFSDAVDVS